MNNIKCLVHTGYGSYGFSIPKQIFEYIKEKHGKTKANELLKIETEWGDIKNYMLKDRSDNSRFNPILIEAFENVKLDCCKYRVCIAQQLNIDAYDGAENSVSLIFY